MRKKKEVGELLCRMWNLQDQADQQDMVDEAFKKMPLEWQLKHIQRWINDGLWDKSGHDEEEFEEVIAEAKQLLGIE